MPALDQWYHLVFTRDSAVARLYVDGTQVASTPVTGSAFYSVPTQAVIGGRSHIIDWPFEQQFFTGLIDEVAIYDRAITALEASELYTNGLPCKTCPTGTYTLTADSLTYVGQERSFTLTIANTSGTAVQGLRITVLPNLNGLHLQNVVVNDNNPVGNIAPGDSSIITIRGSYDTLGTAFLQRFLVSTFDSFLNDTVSVETRVILGYPEYWSSGKIQVHLNPFTSYTIVGVETTGLQPLLVIITDLQGRQLEQHQSRTGASIAVGNTLKSGLYLVYLAYGDQVVIKRIVKYLLRRKRS